ncbi:hypothetical protein AAH991_37285 [Microbispora sp. ZYX-F-249]|uniref:Uncharacterized protein n=1 Tax=Microbispora maris TaxID=3144104 RepID=A0ABV0B1Z0_9ACTN
MHMVGISEQVDEKIAALPAQALGTERAVDQARVSSVAYCCAKSARTWDRMVLRSSAIALIRWCRVAGTLLVVMSAVVAKGNRYARSAGPDDVDDTQGLSVLIKDERQHPLAVISEEGVSHRGLAGTLRDRVPWVAEEFDEPLQEGAVADLLGKTVQLI